MSEIRRVFAQIGPNRVIEGYYRTDGGRLIMLTADGHPVQIVGGDVTAKLSPTSDPDAVARVLTRKIRNILSGEKVDGFDRQIEYPKEGETHRQRLSGRGFDRAIEYPQESFV